MRLGLLGGGGIGSAVARAVHEGHLPGIDIVAVAGSSFQSEAARQTAHLVNARVVTAEELVALQPDWVLEAAGAEAVRAYLPRLLESKVDLVVMSVGALLDEDLMVTVQEHRAHGRQVLVPSGAIGGLDAVRALNALESLHSVSITTKKAPRGLQGAPYLVRNRIQLSETDAALVFEGTAREAVAGFPANVNVAASLSLAGVGPDRTVVRIYSDPDAQRTQHRICAEGEAANIEVVVEALPSPANPRTSYLAALSAIAALRSVIKDGG